MSSLLRLWRGLTSEHRDYFYVYMSAFLWSTTYFFFTPPATDNILVTRLVLALWLISAASGAVLAMVGLFAQDNLILERLGVTLLLVTPVVYVLLQLSIIVHYIIDPVHAVTPWQSRINLVFLGLWIFFFLNKRRRQLTRRVREARITPLAGEADKDGTK